MNWYDITDEDVFDDIPMIVNVNIGIVKYNKFLGDNLNHRLLRFSMKEFKGVHAKLIQHAIPHDLYFAAHFQCGCVKVFYNKDFTLEQLASEKIDVMCDHHFKVHVLGLGGK
jgi:hypothetical protein